MKGLFLHLVVVFAVVYSTVRPVHAEASFAVAKQEQTYMVSALLRKGSDQIVVRVAHSAIEATSEEEAVGKFMMEAGKTYPEYTVAKPLVTPLPSKKCALSI